jgi:hypothetical protein
MAKKLIKREKKMLKYRLSREEQAIVDQASRIIQKAQDRLDQRRKVLVQRLQVAGLMEQIDHGIVTFVKNNGETRVMRFEPRDIWTEDGLNTVYLTVFDREKSYYGSRFRKVNLETVTRIETSEAVYQVIG